MVTGISKKHCIQAVGLLVIFFTLGPAGYAASTVTDQSVETGRKIFQRLCTTCHTIGGGMLVGPDLSGVTMRREESWLRQQIKAPEQLLAEQDPIAMQLLQESNNVPMVSLGLTDAQVDDVIAYLRSIEQQASVEAGLPPQYLPTVFTGLAVLIILTIAGLITGRKNVNPN